VCIIPDPYRYEGFFAQTIFSEFAITANFYDGVEVFPEVATSGGQIVPKGNVTVSNNTLSSKSINKPLINASLFGRVWQQ
jgi:hypothetical protein